jgi:hypothetical protein
MSDLKEIRERHERECAFITGRLGLGAMNIDLAVTMADCAFLLAEVDRLRALCGKAGDYVERLAVDRDHDDVALVAELRRASNG